MKTQKKTLPCNLPWIQNNSKLLREIEKNLLKVQPNTNMLFLKTFKFKAKINHFPLKLKLKSKEMIC